MQAQNLNVQCARTAKWPATGSQLGAASKRTLSSASASGSSRRPGWERLVSGQHVAPAVRQLPKEAWTSPDNSSDNIGGEPL